MRRPGPSPGLQHLGRTMVTLDRAWSSAEETYTSFRKIKCGASLNEMPRASFAERIGEDVVRQSMARSGSFQAIVRSEAGS